MRSLFVRGVVKSRTGDAEKGNEDIAAAKNLDSKIAERFADYGVKP